MKATRYFSIGSDPQNELQLSTTECAPFHLLLGQDQSGNVWVASRTAGAFYQLNGQLGTQTIALEAGDELSIGPNRIDWMQVFGISPAEIVAREAQKEVAEEKQKGLRFQLIFIYIAIALLIFLMAFYI
jgi:hypothetical protein